MINEYFKNKPIKIIDNVNIFELNDKDVQNFGKQWKNYRDVQIDSKNNFDLSINFLKEICHNDIDIFKDKTVLEIGCGSGRFTEHIAKYAKVCFSLDLSDAIFHNVSKNKKNVILLKANLNDLEIINKFDIVFCRGVLQHTPNPTKSILNIHKFIKSDGKVIFDIYKKPKLGFFHPKYFFWRPIISSLFTFETFEKFLIKHIKKLLKIKRILDVLFFKKRFFSDIFIPIWDYYDEFNLSILQYEQLAILDTLDGIFAKYDKPMSNNEVKSLLKSNNIKIIKNNIKKNYFISCK